MSKHTELFTIKPDRWYAWEMLPGYVEEGYCNPYRSPIRVTRVEPLKTGRNVLRLQFYNVFYAEGVRDFDLELRVLKRARTFVFGDLIYGPNGPDRSALICEMNFPWIAQYAPQLLEACPPSAMAEPWASSPQAYLDRVLSGR